MSRHIESYEAISNIDQIKLGVQKQFPEMVIEQLKVSLPADDDGIWFFHLPWDPRDEIQIESSDGKCPFLIGNIRNDETRNGETVDEVVAIICQYFFAKFEGVVQS
jgi:hypothetical protein